MGKVKQIKRIRRIRRAVRVQREEAREREIQAARVGVDTGWRWKLLGPCVPWLRLVMPDRFVLWMANSAARRFRWRVDQGDWRPYDPPRYFTLDELR